MKDTKKAETAPSEKVKIWTDNSMYGISYKISFEGNSGLDTQSTSRKVPMPAR